MVPYEPAFHHQKQALMKQCTILYAYLICVSYNA